MTEQQEFLLVARAAGIKILQKSNGGYWMIEFHERGMRGWNPKLDDGDSRRLATSFYLVVASMKAQGDKPAFTSVYHFNGAEHVVEPHNGDPDAATRLAVWNCALEIAKGMK
jgi:hypothetical protein